MLKLSKDEGTNIPSNKFKMNAKPSELFIVSVINWIVITIFYICAGILKLK